MLAGHVESLPDAQPLVKGLGLVGGGLGAEFDGERAAVDSVGDGILDVGGVNLVGEAGLKVSHLLFQSVQTSLDGAVGLSVVLGAGISLGKAGESLGDGFSNDGDESLLEGGGESLGEKAGDGVVHGGVVLGWLGGVVDDEMTIPHPQGRVKG